MDSDDLREEDVFVFPVSFAQQRLWFFDQFEPNSPFYNIPMAVRLNGRLDPSLLQKVLTEIVRRHEILRTTFDTVDDEPVQIISLAADIPLSRIDLRHLAPKDREQEAFRLANEEAKRPFNLNRGPLLRSYLYQLAEDDFVAVFVMHHIISDGWSMGVFIREIGLLYAALAAGRPSPLPELSIQYADFAHWQREWLKDEVLQAQLTYWQQTLSGELPVLELPTDRPRPAVQTSRGASLSRQLPPALTTALKTLSQQQGTTLFMTLLAAFQTLLYCYTSQETIHVGSPIANRNRSEIEGLIGFFVNTLVLRANLNDELTFRDLLAQVKETTLGAFAHQDLPFEMLVEALQPDRDMSHSPLFQVMFILQNAPAKAQELPDLTLSMVEVETGTSTFDITLSMSEMPDARLDASVEYNTDLFDQATIARLLGHFETLLTSIVADPGQKIAHLPLLTELECQQLLVAWNDTAVAYPNQCIHQLFEAQVERTPGETAVVWQGDHLTYEQLNQKANQLAHHLRQLGVGPECLVAICHERSLEMIIAVLGVLKAGGAYIPLDPTYPPERLKFMLEDSQPTAIVTQISQSDNQWLPVDNQAPLIHLDQDWPTIAQQSNHNPANQTASNNLVYMIYTSGSTGQAKGVMLEHRNLANAFFAWADAYELNQMQSHLQMANFAFDVFSGDMVRALLSGGKLVLCPPEWLLDPAKLYELMRREQVDIAEFVPAVLRYLVQYLSENQQDLSFMRLLICGSDNWYVREYKQFLHFCGPQTRLINSFGLTEATIDSSFYESKLLNTATDQVVPIGRPFANMQLYILDSHQQPVPIGVSGELVVGGAGVARGYYNRPELTAERFIPLSVSGNQLSVNNEQQADSESRLTDYRPPLTAYRTGDRARFLPDGNIEFLGRIDHQVKIRGFRIEPGEVEAALGEHPALRQVAVMPLEAPAGDQRLVAYALADGDEPPTMSELRRFLQVRLPNYMVPAAFMLLTEMPLLANGKINRRALPAPDWAQRDAENAYVAPTTPAQKHLATIWLQVLGIDQISIHDNFFDLGGHSLLATQLVSRIRTAFDIELPLRCIFETPTVAGLAEQVEIAQRAESGIQALAIAPVSRDELLPLSFAQQRLWFLDQLEPNSPLYNLPEAVRLTGTLDVSVLHRCLNEVVQRHEVLRTTFPMLADGRPYQNILPALDLTLPMVDLQDIPEMEREAKARQLAHEDAQRPFNLTSDLLLRATLLRLAPDDHIILLTMHHIIGDNWSTNVLVSEVAALYEAFSHGRFSPLPELPIQYADFAHWQRAWFQGEVLQTQLDYWQETLRASPPLLNLPTDRPRPPVQTYAGDYHTFSLSPELTAALNKLSQSEGTTLFMTLLAAFHTLLYRYSGQEIINVGSPIANRNRRDIEGLIGFFVNILVLQGDLTGEPSFRELLQRVRETALGAYAHQDLPFEMIVDVVQPERNLSHSPLFQVMFVIQNSQMQPGQTLPDLTLRPVEAHSRTAKFDLTLFMLEEDNQLSGAWEYNTDLFDKATIERLVGHFEVLLAGIVANPEQSVVTLPLLTEAERQQLLVEWNDTAVPFPHDQCFHQLFEAQVAKTPDAIAAKFAQQRLTYAQLNQCANQLAHHLRQRGVGPESLVAICVERSLEMLIGLLGILKAGGAYVPLDPGYPAERLAYMIEDAQPKIILTIREGFEFLQNRQSSIVNLKSDWHIIAQASGENPANQITLENVAYVIYTSGSTGKPKGTMLLHRGLVNYLTWCQQAYPITAGDGTPVHSSISFDLTITGLFAPLLAGKFVHLLPEDIDVEVLSQALQQHENYSLIKITPAHLELLSQQLKPHTVNGRTHGFIIGGENLLAESLTFWQQQAPNTILINEYGPTEAVVGCCVYQLPANERCEGSVPIGKPIINTQLYILDKHFQPVPIGVPGELYIGGAGVGRGYLNRPELTAERFIQLSVSVNQLSVNGEQLTVREAAAQRHYRTPNTVYRTGDLCRYLPDGNIEFLGRLDHQVKIHGFRIELGEIEAVLSQHPGVRNTAVIDHEDELGHKKLVAYLVAADKPPNINELRDYLAAQLPEYMVPAAFVTLDKIPLTVNGKVDRRALPLPDALRPKLAVVYEVPRTANEQILADIWAQLLGLQEIGVHDSFFELGGDSILAIQVIARARQAGLHLTPRQLFQEPTIAGLVTVAGTGPGTQAEQGLVTGPVPLTPIQHWFLEQDQPEPHHWNQSIMLTVTERLDSALLETAIAHLLQHHDALRLRFQPGAEGWQQENVGLSDEVPLSLVDLSGMAEQEQTAAIESQAARVQASLNLDDGPLLRLVYFDLGHNRPGRLLVIVHHLAIDGVSWRILLEDLQQAYQQLRQNQPVQLPAKTTSLQQWSQKLTDYAQSAAGESDWWTAVSPQSGLSIPRDVAETAVPRSEATARTLTVSLSPAETEQLLRDVPAAYRTEINDVLLTALVQAFARWTGSHELWLNLESHGRADLIAEVDLSRTVGWFTSLFPVHLSLKDANGPGEALMAIKEQLRQIPNHGVGYGLLRYLSQDMALKHQLSAIPQPEVSFNYLGQMDQGLADNASFAPAPEFSGAERSPQAKRTHLLEIDGGVANGQLELAWTYSQTCHHHETIAQVAQDFITELQTLIAHCQSPEAGGLTLSDVAEFGWEQEDLDDFLAELEGS